ncbi:Dinitrogenase iron-molybdenum cofactor biosynthesis protein [Gracilinema caldarium DSM 7334]|uniref:Dinitrogenase iron-molybdenum cofactor biosynthesis protein n=2 Tax=Gracilinema caldarium TaxID=215591 RepID=F8F2C3_GRAC1|nr:Dinitrogenase iron-molybdenum cofactor biosynthesis protein [Gracilinema caldarium DSM 7334]
MKIAFVTDDGKTISKHFGRARFYEVLTIENGKIVAREQREKMGHAQFAGGHNGHHDHHDHHGAGHGERHGFDPASQDRHARMAQAITDCNMLVAGGMGYGAYESMKQAGITPVVTDFATIDEAVQAYIAGNLKDHTEYLH